MRIEEPIRRRRLVSLTPLIDVVFILLVFFMLASTFVEWHGFPLDTPSQETAALPDEPEVVRIRVGVDGFEVDGEAVRRDALAERIGAAAAMLPQRRAQVAVAADAPLQRVVDAMDAAGRAGVHDVAVVRDTP